MRPGKKERKAQATERHARLAVEARKSRVEALPKSPCYTSMSHLALSLHMGKSSRWEFSTKNDRAFTSKGEKL